MVKIFARFKTLALRLALEYPANFWLMILAGIVMRIVFFAAIYVLYRNLPAISGWSESELYLIMSYLYISEGLCSILFDGVWFIPALIFQGGLDVFLSRPVSPLFQVLVHDMGLHGFGVLGLGLVMMVISLVQMGGFTLFTALLSLLFIVCGMVIRLGTTLIASSLPFWVKGSTLNMGYMVHALGDYAKYPINIYPVWMRIILLFVIPTAFIGYVPAVILRTSNWWLILALAAMSAAFFLAARAVFYAGVKKYESAGM